MVVGVRKEVDIVRAVMYRPTKRDARVVTAPTDWVRATRETEGTKACMMKGVVGDGRGEMWWEGGDGGGWRDWLVAGGQQAKRTVNLK